MRLLIFNPDTDYALASNSRFYTPPKIIEEFRRENALLPLKYAREGDMILLPEGSDISEYAIHDVEKAMRLGVKIIKPVDLERCNEIFARITKDQSFIPSQLILPWGWNRSLRHYLSEHGILDIFLPTEDFLDNLRRISHRRTAILFNQLINAKLRELRRHDLLQPEGREFDDVEMALEWERDNHPVFFKAPWSSSGRGVVLTEGLDMEKHLRPWIRGIIRRQGSVTAERKIEKRLDFASEWMMTPVGVEYIGLSLFNTSNRGKYHGNFIAGQEELRRIIIEKVLATDLDLFISIQNEMLGKVGRGYVGPVGIDMIASDNSKIIACIEINFRMTMGMIGL